jgi:hypothetical protein
MKNEKHEIAKEAMKALSELEETTKIEELVKDNKIEFTIEKDLYRVRKPSYSERQEIETIKRQKYLEFIKDNTYLFRKQWIDQYKNKGIDIIEMENKIKVIESEIRSTLLRLAKAQEPNDITKLKNTVLKLRDEQFSISIEVTDLLSHSIENQLLIYVNSYTTYLVLEKKVENETWKRVFDSYKDFEESDSKIIKNAFYYINMLIYQYGINEEK